MKTHQTHKQPVKETPRTVSRPPYTEVPKTSQPEPKAEAVNPLQQRVLELEEALRWYANPDNNDHGERARKLVH